MTVFSQVILGEKEYNDIFLFSAFAENGKW